MLLLFASADPGAFASKKSIVVKSTDTNHANADLVQVEESGKDATVVITRDRGIGSAQIRIAGKWKGHLRMKFKNFSSLEKFVASNGDTCVEASFRPGAESNSGDDLNITVDGADIRLEIPAELVRSKKSRTWSLSWIDAYRS